MKAQAVRPHAQRSLALLQLYAAGLKEPAGEPVQIVSAFVGGLKNLPLRYALRAGA